MVFPVFMYGCQSWTVKKAECRRIDAFKLWWRRPLRVLWTARRSNQSILKEISPEYSLEGLVLKQKLQLLHPHVCHWKNHSFDYANLCQQSNVSAFNMLSRLVIAFLPRSKCLLILWLPSPFSVILEPPKIVCHCFHCFSIYLP